MKRWRKNRSSSFPIKKFFKTYYSRPHKNNKIDLVFERGYKNIVVRYNGKEVKRFPNAPSLMEIQEITTPDDSVIHLKFLKDHVDFEVFLNGQQIDNSETSPKKVVDNLRWPIYFSIAWYILVLGVCFFTTPLLQFVINDPFMLFTDLFTFYMLTSSLIVMIILSVALIGLKNGSLLLYFSAMIAICGDALFGAVFMLFLTTTFGSFDLTFIFGLIVPLLFKSAAVRGFITNIKKYQQYIKQKAGEKPKVDAELVDV